MCVCVRAHARICACVYVSVCLCGVHYTRQTFFISHKILQHSNLQMYIPLVHILNRRACKSYNLQCHISNGRTHIIIV